MITRRDLCFEQQACQAIHAARLSAKVFPFNEEPHLCLCTVKNEARLHHELEKLRSLGIEIAEWREPDLNNSLTAIATGLISEDQRHPFRNFQLLRLGKEEAVAA